MRHIKRTLLIIGTLLSLLLTWGGLNMAPSLAAADSTTDAKNNACQAINGTANNGSCTVDGPSLDTVIATVINILSVIIGITAVIMIMVGGFRYITSAGDASKASGAKNTLVYAVIGLIIVALAQAFVQFVVAKATAPPAKKAAYVTPLNIES